jgi:hypothetical protein
MSSEPTLQEALRSIYDLPPDVPAVVRAVLIAIRLDNTATEEDIVNWTGWSESSVERARRFSSEHGLIATTYFYRVNGDRAASLEVPNSPNAPRGKFDGTETNLNYVRIRQLKEASSVTGRSLSRVLPRLRKGGVGSTSFSEAPLHAQRLRRHTGFDQESNQRPLPDRSTTSGRQKSPGRGSLARR